MTQVFLSCRLVILMNVECNCKCFMFWNLGTSFLLSGGLVTDLFDINKDVQSVVESVDVQIRSRAVDVRHKFVLVPLVYNKFTCDRDFQGPGHGQGQGLHPCPRPVLLQVHGLQQTRHG